MKRMYKRIAKLMSAILCMALIFTILPAIPASAATSLRGESIYQIMVDRYYDGDPTNNATGEAFRYTENTQDDYRYMHGGDWQGIIEKIPYIKGMGYTAIWISPVTDPQLWGVPDVVLGFGSEGIIRFEKTDPDVRKYLVTSSSQDFAVTLTANDACLLGERLTRLYADKHTRFF